jgi:hypothetical protein
MEKSFVKIIISLFIVISFGNNVSGQYFENPEKRPTFKDKLFFGGGLGLQFGNITFIDVSPQIGYKLTERIHPGIGFTYSYYKNNYYTPSINYSSYAVSGFVRFFIFEGLFAQAEAEYLNTKVFYITGPSTYETKRKWIDSYFVGGGYYQKFSERSGMYFSILWNLNETEESPYTNPIMRIGFNF